MSLLRCLVAAALIGGGAAPAWAARDRTPPVLQHTPCAAYRPGHDYVVRVRITDASPLFDPKVIYRSPAGAPWKTAPLTVAGASYQAVIRAADLRGTLEYFVEAFDNNGNGPARYGTRNAPARVQAAADAAVCAQYPGDPEGAPPPAPKPRPPVAPPQPPVTTPPATTAPPAKAPPPTTTPPPKGSALPGALEPPKAEAEAGTCDATDRPLYCEPWLWGTVGGVVLAGVIIGVAVGVASSGSPPPDTWSVEIVGPSPGQGLVRW